MTAQNEVLILYKWFYEYVFLLRAVSPSFHMKYKSYPFAVSNTVVCIISFQYYTKTIWTTTISNLKHYSLLFFLFISFLVTFTPFFIHRRSFKIIDRSQKKLDDFHPENIADREEKQDMSQKIHIINYDSLLKDNNVKKCKPLDPWSFLTLKHFSFVDFCE